MPFQTERQQAAESVLEMYIAALLAESHILVDPMSSSSSGSSDSSSDNSSGKSASDLPTTSEVLLGVSRVVKICGFSLAYVRVTPDCIDVLVSVLQDDPVFHNQSNLPQMPVAAHFVMAGKMRPSPTKNGRNLCALRWLKQTKSNGTTEEFNAYYSSLTSTQRTEYDNDAANLVATDTWSKSVCDGKRY
ncbi:hypothetical protein EDB19DRAFT_1946917 [Suillus lakei]|nr:hypothetical protein EDB19DRAFT_1946917 [Suillus lakei]